MAEVKALNLEAEVTLTLAALDLPSTDSAASRLAREYAKKIDSGDSDVLLFLGPKLHSLLNDLGATPAGRSKLKTQKVADTGGKLQAFRSA